MNVTGLRSVKSQYNFPMRKVLVGVVSAVMLISSMHSSSAVEKLDVIVSVDEDHPFLPGYEFGTSGTLGDVWSLDVEVLDTDGDPAEGAVVRVYLGKKSVGTGRVGFNGVAKVKLNLNKLGVQTFKVVASDSEPAGKGETIFKLKVNEPKMVRVFSPVKNCEGSKCENRLRPDPKLIMDAGCNDVYRYWTSYTTEAIKNGGDFFQDPKLVPPATWPFTTTKRRGPMFAMWTGSTEFPFAQWVIDQASVPTGDDQDMRGFYDEPLGTQALCQNDSGELIVLK
jgi:hypothetical protein